MAVSITRRHNSIGSLLDQASKSPRDNTCVSDNQDRDEDWFGSPSLDQSISWARYGGWEPDVATEFRDMFESHLPKLRSYVADELIEGRDVSGFEVDVAGHCIGEPEHMHEWLPAENIINKRAFCVLIGHSISSGVTAEEIFIRGQAVVALVRALATMGYELEVWSEQTLNGYDGSGTQYTTLTCLHHAGEIMDQSALEFSIGNPSWLRRIIFAAEETESQEIRDRFQFNSLGGYGRPASPIHRDTVNADLVLDLGRAWFGEDWGSDTEKMAQSGYDWVVKQLKASGVIAEDA